MRPNFFFQEFAKSPPGAFELRPVLVEPAKEETMLKAALAAAIVRLARDASLRDRLAASGRRRVEDRFSAATSVRRIGAIYEEELIQAGVLASISGP